MKNKGLTLTEIIVSFSLLFVVLMFILNILTGIQGHSSKSIDTKHLLNASIITKEIQEEFEERQLIGVSTCDDKSSRTNDTINKLHITTNSTLRNEGEANCVNFNYEDGTNGYLVYYNFKNTSNQTKNMIGYISDTKTVLRETGTETNDYVKVQLDCNEGICIFKVNLPITSKNLNDYDLNLSYVFNEGEQEFIIPTTGIHDTYKLAINMGVSKELEMFKPDIQLKMENNIK